MINILKMAFRDLGRNRRRTFFSALALGIGLALLLMMAGVISWEVQNSFDQTISLVSGNLQVRSASYNPDKASLAWKDLIASPDGVTAQVASLAPVKVATPRLLASGIAQAGDTSLGVRIIGIDPASPANAPFANGIVDGKYLTADDSTGILIGKTLADKLGLAAGRNLTLLVNTSDGSVVSQSFSVRGIFQTATPSYDGSTAFLPLAKAQAITGAGDRASMIFILLKDSAQSDAVVKALTGSQYKTLTFADLNPLIVTVENLANSFMYVLYLIVLGLTATVIINTLIMSVFERTREIGILSALGMPGGKIMAMFFAESCFLAFGGIALGVILGVPLVSWIGSVGIPFPDIGANAYMIGSRLYAALSVKDAVTLSVLALIVTLLAALYPARLAAGMEPVEALHKAQ